MSRTYRDMHRYAQCVRLSERRTLRRFLTDGGDAGVAGEPHVTAIQCEVANDGFQQGRFAGAVAADQTDAPAGVDREIGPVQQGSATETDDGSGNDEQRHEAGERP